LNLPAAVARAVPEQLREPAPSVGELALLQAGELRDESALLPNLRMPGIKAE
jgi:hypothetical protein